MCELMCVCAISNHKLHCGIHYHRVWCGTMGVATQGVVWHHRVWCGTTGYSMTPQGVVCRCGSTGCGIQPQCAHVSCCSEVYLKQPLGQA